MRRFSKLETGILWVAKSNIRKRQTPRREDEFDVTMEEVLLAYFGIAFKSGFVKFGNTYIEQSTPPGKLATDRYIRAKLAIWYAVSRLEDDYLLQSFWGALGTSIWLAGANLTAAGVDEMTRVPDVIATKKRWGRVVDPPGLRIATTELDELEKVILRLAFGKRIAGESRGRSEPDLLEWEVLHAHHGFRFQQRWDGELGTVVSTPGSFEEEVSKSREYLVARQAISEACRRLENQGMIKMGGPGAPSTADWANLVRGWGWNSQQQTEIVGKLFPSGAWDTIDLTNKGIAAARAL